MPPNLAQGCPSFPKSIKGERKGLKTRCLAVAHSLLRLTLYSLCYCRNLRTLDITIPTVQLGKNKDQRNLNPFPGVHA